ncbi:MAG: 1-acyl-sn-glycerol-3-phosphate acyltransferase [Prolixibacteraceae bacterium]|nr:1-acyl-sn-glycerol-3-phosphate acyltransferase [Prolixibacteraceae bacterium]
MMGKHIEDWSIRYAIIKPLVGIVHRLQYRKIIVTGKENIPKGKPFIFAPNHQNGLMDPLAIVFTNPYQPVFLARADVFKSKIAASILRIFKIMPVYRLRDGKDQLSKNEETFKACVRIMKKNKPFCLFPEAAHIGMKSMLPHKKAIPRLAFMAGEQTNYSIDLQIVPVGINYSHYSRYRSDLMVNYGPPVPVKPFFEILQKKGEKQATAALRDKIFTEVAKSCIHVPDKENYTIYEQAFELMYHGLENEKPRTGNEKNPIFVYQHLIKKLEPALENNSALLENLKNYTRKIDLLKIKLGLSGRTLHKGRISFLQSVAFVLFQLVLIPVSLAGLLINGWLFALIYYGISRKVKDPQFISTFTFGGALMLFPLWIIGQFFIWFSLGTGALPSILFTLLSIPCGIVAWEAGQAWLRFFNRVKFNFLMNAGKKSLLKLIEIRNKFIDVLNSIKTEK